ncbi:methyltransferase domain-containing protein [Shewanella sp. JM162201]|uniref:Methyltransferase domain-containing protein n=1 Tax=Shewanella jiangmenensis TaxID=2837387 RepID=A0ABS5UZ94_9GAMM|nr:methyltransferase domain-containing protein [Shewanella jiangmenensis]MBT1442958.1 methyltransferase domain-containing protein [Shewanella jiangmenensis]
MAPELDYGLASSVDVASDVAGQVPCIRKPNNQKPSIQKPSIQEDVATHFSRAADYTNHDVLQRLTAAKLKSMARLQGTVLDVGAGPGTAFDGVAPSSVIAVDIAFGMCERLKARFSDAHVLCADATRLPLADGSIDSAYSNLALQWCQPFSAAIDELARVIRPGGEVAAALVCDGSLPELEALGFSVNHFMTAQVAQAAFSAKDWQHLDVRLVTETLHFDNLRALIYSIKGVGANARRDAGSAGKLRGRNDWLMREAQAERTRTAAGLPLSYQILYVVARRRKES